MMADRFIRARRYLRKLGKLYEHISGQQKTTYVWDRVPFYREIWSEAAAHRNLSLVELADEFWELRDQNEKPVTRINNCYVELDNPVVLHLAGEKGLTYQLLEAENLPVAPHAVFDLKNLATLRAFIENNPGPWVVKPESGTSSGMGVSTNLHDYDACVSAAILASLYSKQLLIEKFVPGEVYRLLYVGGEMISAVRRKGLWIAGDGRTRLDALVTGWFSKQSTASQWQGWQDDHDLAATTAVQGLEPATVLEKDRRVLVKSVAELSDDNEEIRTVYNQDMTRELHPMIIEQAAMAARALRSEFCGVDLILLDPKLPLGPGNGVIGEVNTTPGLHHHYRVDGAGEGTPAAEAVLNYYFSSRRLDH